MNPIINQMFNNSMGNFLQLFKNFKNSNNQNMMMQTLMQTNPQIQEVMKFINQNGGDAKTVFYNTAKQKGVDPNIIINQLNNM